MVLKERRKKGLADFSEGSKFSKRVFKNENPTPKSKTCLVLKNQGKEPLFASPRSGMLELSLEIPLASVRNQQQPR